MTSPAYQASQSIGNNFGRAQREQQDNQALEAIMSKALDSGDPQVYKQSIVQILQKVSPEKRGVAMQVLQNAQDQILEKRKEAKQEEIAKELGYNPNAPAAIQKAQYDERQTNATLDRILGNKNPQQPNGTPRKTNELNSYSGTTPQAMPFTNQAAKANAAASSLAQQQEGKPLETETPSPAAIPEQAPEPQKGFYEGLSNEQLVQLSGVKGFSEQAKQELRRRQEEEKNSKSAFEPESEKLEAKRVAELSTQIEKEFAVAKEEDVRLDRQLALSQKGDLSTPLMVKTLDTIGLPLGILSNPDTEEYRKLETDFIRNARDIFPGGRITNYEVQTYLKTIPSLMNSPEGIQSIIRNRKLMNEARKVRYDEYKKILKENNGRRPQNMFIMLEERTSERISEIEDKFKEGIDKATEKFQTPIRMIAPNGQPVDIPPGKLESAIKAGAKFK